MLASQRQKEIQKQLKANGAVTVTDLTERFGVSIETIRRDLLAMEKAGLLSRVHGGAVAVTEMMTYLPLKERDREQSDQKDALARVAATLVKEGDYIAIGTGSTPVHFAQELKKHVRSLTVVTYSLGVFDILKDMPGFRLILLGGQYIPEENTFYGQITLDMLDSLHVRKSFVFPSAISMEHGIWGFEETLYPMQQKLLRCCDQAYILADSSKFERTALYKVADMRPEYIYVTDPELPAHLRTLYAENGLTVLTEPGDSHAFEI